MVGRVRTDSEKLEFVLSSFQRDVTIAQHCAKHGVSTSTFYRWRKLVLAGLATFIFGDKEGSRGRNTIEAG